MSKKTNLRVLAFAGLTFTAFFVAVRPVTSHAETTADSTSAEQSLISLEKDWAHAYLTDDAAFLENLLSPTFVLTNVRGVVSTKDEEVGEVRDHFIHYDKFESSDMKVHLYGDTAFVTGETYIKATVTKTDRPINASVRFTDVFVRHDGKWQAIVSQATALPAKS